MENDDDYVFDVELTNQEMAAIYASVVTCLDHGLASKDRVAYLESVKQKLDAFSDWQSSQVQDDIVAHVAATATKFNKH